MLQRRRQRRATPSQPVHLAAEAAALVPCHQYELLMIWVTAKGAFQLYQRLRQNCSPDSCCCAGRGFGYAGRKSDNDGQDLAFRGGRYLPRNYRSASGAPARLGDKNDDNHFIYGPCRQLLCCLFGHFNDPKVQCCLVGQVVADFYFVASLKHLFNSR